MPNPKLPRPKTMMFISALLCIALVPLVYAVVNRVEQHEQYFAEIQQQTESDRRQLEHNFEAFQKLSPAEQDKYRELNAQLNGEHRHLKEVMTNYNDFLRSLDPVDRADIERATKYHEKIRAIKTVVNRLNDESQRQLELIQESYANNQRKSKWDEGRWRPVPLSAEEIAAMTRVLESHATATPTQKQFLNSLSSVDRLAHVLSLVLVASGGSESKPFFNSQLTHELISALSAERQEYFQRSKDYRAEQQKKFDKEVESGEADPDRPPFYLRRTIDEHHEMVIIGTCLYTFKKTLDENAPSPEDMPNFLKELPPNVKADLLENRPGNLYEDLVEEYYRRKETTLSKATKVIQDLASQRFPKPPSRGGRRPGDRERPDDPRREERGDEDGDRGRSRGPGPDRNRNFGRDRDDDSRKDDCDSGSCRSGDR